MLALAAAEIALHRGPSCGYCNTEKAQAVFDNACESKSVMRASADAEIAVSRGLSSDMRNADKDQAEFDKLCTRK